MYASSCKRAIIGLLFLAHTSQCFLHAGRPFAARPRTLEQERDEEVDWKRDQVANKADIQLDT